MQQEAKVLAKYLLGTQMDEITACHELGFDPTYFEFYDGFDYLYELVFQCDGCGFWCSTEELNNVSGDEFCNDCLYLEVSKD